jgi:hypothetical protein
VTTPMVAFRGIQVAEGWPEKIQAAQLLTSCCPNGEAMERVRYGSEKQDWRASDRACHDCCVIEGEFHVPGCDVEQCPSCENQIFGCACDWSSDSGERQADKPPKPFTERQLRIVSARHRFSWHHVGFALNGDAIFEVSNRSDMRLPYLSIGVQGRGGTKLIGGVWLDVSGIEPGRSGLVKRDCYKDKLLPEEVEFLSKEDPTPETRDRYWEFNRLPKRIVPDA